MNTEELREKLWEPSMHVDHVLWLGGMHPNGVSEKLIELLEYDTPKEVAELFELGKNSYVLECLEGEEYGLAAASLVEEKTGFVVMCEAPVPQYIRLNPAGEVESWSTGGIYWIIKAYGESPDEAIKKALLIYKKQFEQEVKKQCKG